MNTMQLRFLMGATAFAQNLADDVISEIEQRLADYSGFDVGEGEPVPLDDDTCQPIFEAVTEYVIQWLTVRVRSTPSEPDRYKHALEELYWSLHDLEQHPIELSDVRQIKQQIRDVLGAVSLPAKQEDEQPFWQEFTNEFLSDEADVCFDNIGPPIAILTKGFGVLEYSHVVGEKINAQDLPMAEALIKGGWVGTDFGVFKAAIIGRSPDGEIYYGVWKAHRPRVESSEDAERYKRALVEVYKRLRVIPGWADDALVVGIQNVIEDAINVRGVP